MSSEEEIGLWAPTVLKPPQLEKQACVLLGLPRSVEVAGRLGTNGQKESSCLGESFLYIRVLHPIFRWEREGPGSNHAIEHSWTNHFHAALQIFLSSLLPQRDTGCAVLISVVSGSCVCAMCVPHRSAYVFHERPYSELQEQCCHSIHFVYVCGWTLLSSWVLLSLSTRNLVLSLQATLLVWE